MGIEAIRHLITDLESRVRLHPKATRLQNYLVELNGQLSKMELQSCLMSMAINCCMDYTKVTSGASLVCQMDTVDIRSCLENVSTLAPLMFGNKLRSLCVESLPDPVCPFVITDGRWLQENLLSLMEQCLREAKEIPLSLSIRIHLEYPQQAEPIVEKDNLSLKVPETSEAQIENSNETLKPPAILIPRRPSELSLQKDTSPAHFMSPRANRVRLSIGSVKSEKSDDSLIEALPPSEGGTTPVASYHAEPAHPHHNTNCTSDALRETISFVNRFQVRMLVIEIHRTASVPDTTVDNSPHVEFTDERMFLHGKSSADMAFVNMKARLKFLHGQYRLHPDPDGISDAIVACLAIPYRPDLNRNLSFMGQSFCLASSSSLASADLLGGGPEEKAASSAKVPSLLVSGQSSSLDTTDTRASVFQSCSALTTPRFDSQSSYLGSMPTTARTIYSESAAGSLESEPTGQPVTTSCKVVFNPLYSLSEGSNAASFSRSSINQVASSAWSSPESFVKPPIILVDDSSMVLKLTRTVLERSGYKVQVARNGLEAVQAVSDHLASCGGPGGQLLRSRELWPVVLMDLQMPVLDGIEAVRRIRTAEREASAAEQSPRLVVLALSISDADPVVSEALSAGCDAFLQKPFNLDDFEAVVTRLRDILSLRT